VLTAEDLYTAMLTENAAASVLAPLERRFGRSMDRQRSAQWEVRSNARPEPREGVLGVPAGREAMHTPVRSSGLSYTSRGLLNYKASQWGRGMVAALFGTSQRDWPMETTLRSRESR
jgi:hypothetical protein